MEVEISLSIIIGYMLGGINPAFILSKIKRVDMLQSGTGNLGTTNAFIHFGKGWGLYFGNGLEVLSDTACNRLYFSFCI